MSAKLYYRVWYASDDYYADGLKIHQQSSGNEINHIEFPFRSLLASPAQALVSLETPKKKLLFMYI